MTHRAEIESLITAHDVEHIDQGVSLLQALGDTSLWDALLEGIHYDAEERRLVGEESPSRSAWPYRHHAMQSLVAMAPTERGKALRSRVDALRLDGSLDENDDLIVAPISLRGLDAYPRLRTLRVENASRVGDAERIAMMRSLEGLAFEFVRTLPDRLVLPATIRTIAIHHPDLTSWSCAGWKHLHTVVLRGATTPRLDVLRDARRVHVGCNRHHARIALDAATMQHLADLEHLDELDFYGVEAPLEALHGKKLRRFRMIAGDAISVEDIAQLDVEELWIGVRKSSSSTPIDLRPLAAIERLRVLGLNMAPEHISGCDVLDLETIWGWSGAASVVGKRWRFAGDADWKPSGRSWFDF